MAAASDLAVLRGRPTYNKEKVEALLGHAYSLYVGRPRKTARLGRRHLLQNRLLAQCSWEKHVCMVVNFHVVLSPILAGMG